MANILLIAGSTSHATTTKAKDALVAGGHTVTTVTQTQGANETIQGVYDAVVTVRISAQAIGSPLAEKLLTDNQAGVPLIIDIATDTTTVDANSLVRALGLTDLGSNLVSGQNAINITNNTHFITNGQTLGANALQTTSSYLATVTEGAVFVGEQLALGDPDVVAVDNGLSFIAVPSNTTLVDSRVTGARIVALSVYIGGTPTALYQTLLNNAVDWALPSQPPQVGQTISYQGDTWNGNPTSFTQQWLRDGIEIAGATAKNYTLVAADAGTMISVRVTATNANGSTTVTASAVGPIRAAPVWSGPANIALLTDSATHNAATSTRDALVAGGHTVTIVQDVDVGTHNFAPYDLVVAVRTALGRQGTISPVLTSLNDGGKPLLISLLDSGHTPGNNTASLAITMGLVASPVFADDSETTLNIGSPNDHEIRGNIALGNNVLFSVSNWVVFSEAAVGKIGTPFISGVSPYQTYRAAIAVEIGTAKLTSGNTGARIALIPMYLISGAYTADHSTLLNNAVVWALS